MGKIFNLRKTIGNYVYEINRIPKPDTLVSGYTTRCVDNMHVVFLEWDNISKSIMLQDVLNVSNIINSSFYVLFSTFESTDVNGNLFGNYHCFFLDKLYFSNVNDVMRITHCDNVWRSLAFKSRHRSWVLRFTSKGERSPPKLIDCVFNSKSNNKCSLAHFLLLRKLYPKIPNVKLNFDGNKVVNVTHYLTANRTKNFEVD